jgi:arabinofuranosyltransferase
MIDPSLAAPPLVDVRTRGAFGRATGRWELAAFLLPLLTLAWMGWQHRWTADDAFINYRIVGQLLAGHGPVFNAGQRVEAGTSPAWLAVLALLDLLLPLRLEWIAVFASIGASVTGLAFAMLGTRRVLVGLAVPGTLVPLGAMAYAVRPPAWDFSTSGLEGGLSLLWLGLSWWVLTGRITANGARRSWCMPMVLGFGPLVRPDFLIFSVFFLAAFLWLDRKATRRTQFVTLGLAAALPVAYELFRMGYYGEVVPNTAIAKEGTLSYWSWGWFYLRDFVGPHLLLVPLAVLAVAIIPLCARQRDVRIVFGSVIGAGVAHGLYVVRVGGDYMHGRVLLPTLFVLLMPVSIVAVRAWQWALVAVIAIWATASAFILRPHFQLYAKISDERIFQTQLTGVAHPVTLGDFSRREIWAIAGLYTRLLADGGASGLVVDPGSTFQLPPRIPLRADSDAHAPLVAFWGAVGVYAYAAGNDVEVVDLFGIVDWLSAHQQLDLRKRPGHEKFLPNAWILARYADTSAPIPPWVVVGGDDPTRKLQGVSPADVQAARAALQCGDLARLAASTQGALTPGRIVRNIAHAFSLSTFRFDGNDPLKAERELCGS